MLDTFITWQKEIKCDRSNRIVSHSLSVPTTYYISLMFFGVYGYCQWMAILMCTASKAMMLYNTAENLCLNVL